jgi:cytoskeletal protein CcmA (bactofilin family)
MLDQGFDSGSSSVSDPTRQGWPSNVAKTASSISAVGAQSTIGKSLVIKGEITGSGSVLIEGNVEGTIDLPDDRVTVGLNGRVSANISAKNIVVLGELLGDCFAGDHLEIRSQGCLSGDVVVSRISVEDGAYLTGSIDIRREPARDAVEPVEPSLVN